MRKKDGDDDYDKDMEPGTCLQGVIDFLGNYYLMMILAKIREKS